MMRSMYSAVTGLKNHLLRMDAIGNNIANVNTPGYKSSRVTFKEAMYQTLRGGSAASGRSNEIGGTNPQQVGLGSMVGSVDVVHGQGPIESTGNLADCAIDGAGFFMVQNADGGIAYSRAGNFTLDSAGYLTNSDGLYLLGWIAQDGLFGETNEASLAPLRIPIYGSVEAKATTQMKWAGNLGAEDVLVRRTAQVFDSQGGSHLLIFEFQKTASNTWTCTLSRIDDQTPTDPFTTEIVFETDGNFKEENLVQPFHLDGTLLGGVDDLDITVDFSHLVQQKAESSANAAEWDGHPPGVLETFSVDNKGCITGVYSNDLVRPIGKIALARFANDAGLVKVGSGLYAESGNVGARLVDAPGSSGLGGIVPSSLEMSDVDLAREFTSMLITQRGFQANSRVISASDEMLRELVGLGR